MTDKISSEELTTTEIQHLAFKIKLKPTDEQKIFLSKSCGCARFIYNHYLGIKNDFYTQKILPVRNELGYENLSREKSELKKQVENIKTQVEELEKQDKDLSKKEKKNTKQIKELNQQKRELNSRIKEINEKLDKIKEKTTYLYKDYIEPSLSDLKEEYPWLKESNSQGLCFAQMHLNTAFKNFYEGRTSFPNFHKKSNGGSYSDCMVKDNCLDLTNFTIELPKIGKIKIVHISVPSWYKNRIKLCNITVSKTPTNEYFVSILYEVKILVHLKPETNLINENQVIGLDFDLNDCYIDSNGKSAMNDFGFKKCKQLNEKKLSHRQRQWERKRKGSKHKEKARIKVAEVHETTTNQRNDWIEKESLRLSKKYQVIYIEDLNIARMKRNHKKEIDKNGKMVNHKTKKHSNSKNYDDISWSRFVSKLQYKCDKNGSYLVKIDQFYPSSQTCSNCGYKNPIVQKYHLENWTCPNCGTKHQRDINAAINIKKEGLRQLKSEFDKKGTEGTVSASVKSESRKKANLSGSQKGSIAWDSTVDELARQMNLSNTSVLNSVSKYQSTNK